MAQFSVNAQRFDPYKNFKFRVKLGTRTVAGISKVSGLKRTKAAGERSAGKGRKLRHTKSEPITLERGLTQDKQFAQWANKARNYQRNKKSDAALRSARRDVTIEQYNEAGQLAISYKVFRCWVSEFQAVPDLDSNANAIAIEHIKLENEGWTRDSVKQPKEGASG